MLRCPCKSQGITHVPDGPPPDTVSAMADRTDAEHEATLVLALADLKMVTERRRSLEHGSPGMRSALQRERRAMEVVRDLVEGLGEAEPGERTESGLPPNGLQGLGIPIPEGLELLDESRRFGRGRVGRLKASFDGSPFRQDPGQTLRRRGCVDRRQTRGDLTSRDLVRLVLLGASELQDGLGGVPDLAGERRRTQGRSERRPASFVPEGRPPGWRRSRPSDAPRSPSRIASLSSLKIDRSHMSIVRS